MYKAPPNRNVGGIGNHLSVSSSVYSSHDSPRLEGGVNKEDQRSDFERGGLSCSESFESSHSMYTANMAHEPSNQTFQTYITANEGDDVSFSSINRSLVRSNSIQSITDSSFSDVSGFGNEYDDDMTPIVAQTATYAYDPTDDKTPIISSFGFNSGTGESSNQISDEKGQAGGSNLNLPQRELDPKFKRLSMTLQQSTVLTSGDSHDFMNSFQQNIDRASKHQPLQSKRASEYYNKIKSSKYDRNDYYRESKKVQPVDTDSISSVSNRSSIISHSIDDFDTTGHSNKSYDRDIHSVSNSSSSFVFNDCSGNQDTSPQKSLRSAYNARSNISPLKVVKKSDSKSLLDEVPIRKDLVTKFEKIAKGDAKNLSEKEKNAYFITNEENQISKGMLEKYPNGLNITITDSVLDPKNKSYEEISPVRDTQELVESNTRRHSVTESTASSKQSDTETLSSLFIKAIHSFDSSTLQSEADSSICLSFEKDDLAFIHTIDDSGWGEVTLIETLHRGWIPMNYFSIAVCEDKDDEFTNDEDLSNKIPNSYYLQPLYNSCGKFLINPLSHKTRRGNYTFSIRVINSIRDGVRLLLQETDCLSRSNEIVTKKPIVRKSRKSLLADWYNLMLKANEFKSTSNFNKIEILTLMVYQVIRKATSFLQLWSIESKQLIKRETERKLQSDLNNYPLLSTPPLAKQRITEINGLLYSYLALIIGRLDLIEHNPVGCDILETIIHHVILLLRELLFISKVGSDFSSEKPADLDGALDSLLSLVSDLVSAVKNLVVKTNNETEQDKKYMQSKNGTPKDYYYTQEGGDLIQIASKMISSIRITVSSIRKLLEVTGDFKLNSERSYPNYAIMKIEPEEFVNKCSLGIAKSHIANDEITTLKPAVSKKANRYSVLRSGKTGELSVTPEGANLLHDVLGFASGANGRTSFITHAEFKQFTPTSDVNNIEDVDNIKNELMVDHEGNLLGASFKGLVYTLTNEDSPPEYFFVSTFFVCFRSFANGIDLIEELITRFDIQNNYLSKDKELVVTKEIKLKNRRRLIVKIFQIWMESYWNHESDYSLLTTLINFFNEGISVHLPLEAMKLIEIGGKLSARPLIESQSQKIKNPKNNTQIIKRSITVTKSNRPNVGSSDISVRYSMVDGYELSKINTNSSTSSSFKSISLPLPLGIGNQTSSSSTLLSKNQISTIEKVNLTYRAILGTSWCDKKYIDSKTYLSLDLATTLRNWYNVCDQSWVLSNYRPNLLDFNGLEIAKQLTIIESQIFCNIKPNELLNENYSTKRAHLKLAPNIRQSLLFTNSLSGYVLETILQPKVNQKMRVNMIKTWLKVAISCLYLRNFNSLAAIITSLQSHLITRLTKVWEELSDKYNELFEYLSSIIHPQKNYHVYRNKLRNFLVSNEYDIPIVPYFSLFLQDLTFVTDGNPSYRKANTFLNQKLINIDKYLKITRIIANIENLQIPYTGNNFSKENKRSSYFFSASKSSSLEDFQIISVPALQELILLELWKVSQLYKTEDDRAWKLSCAIQSRDAH